MESFHLYDFCQDGLHDGVLRGGLASDDRLFHVGHSLGSFTLGGLNAIQAQLNVVQIICVDGVSRLQRLGDGGFRLVLFLSEPAGGSECAHEKRRQREAVNVSKDLSGP